jgi:2-polyprenyl-6-methoxyphenol hydroxylase-like FAD-dependent oxidoreductase
MIHDTRGRLHFQAYGGRPEEYLLSVSRAALNQMLLDACQLDERGLITVHFGKKCTEVDLDRSVLTFEDVPEPYHLNRWADAVSVRTVYSPPSSHHLERKRRARQRAAHAHPVPDAERRILGTPPQSTSADFDGGLAFPNSSPPHGWALSTPPSVVSTRHVTASFVVGADGAYSRVRRAMQRLPPFDYEQEYIPTAYKELTIPPWQTGMGSDQYAPYLLAPNALHIWPRHRFMLIALPNQDGSFTATLFMNWLADAAAPNTPSFEDIRTPLQIQRFFEMHFPDLSVLVPRLVTEYQRNPVAPLFTVRCAPFHYRGRAVLVGDAAHTMVPFYGQGCNAALEDCRILAELLQEELRRALLRAPRKAAQRRLCLPSSAVVVDFEDAVEDNDIEVAKHMLTSTINEEPRDALLATDEEEVLDLERVFQAYTTERKPNTDAITSLALENYWEMASKTSSRLFRWKREMQNQLHALMPSYFMSLYHMISFSHIPYAESVRRAQRQDRLFNTMFRALALSGIGLAGYGLWCARHALRKQT